MRNGQATVNGRKFSIATITDYEPSFDPQLHAFCFHFSQFGSVLLIRLIQSLFLLRRGGRQLPRKCPVWSEFDQIDAHDSANEKESGREHEL